MAAAAASSAIGLHRLSNVITRERFVSTLAALAGLRAWRGALFTANIHVCFFTLFYLLLVTDFQRSSVEAALLLLSLVLYQSYGFLVNDYFDMPYDKLVGKEHGLAKLEKWQVVSLLVTLAGSSNVLLFSVQHDWVSEALFAMAYLLATLYSAPPVRLKGRGILSFICDILIEKTLPVFIIFSFFQHYGLDTILILLLITTLQFNTVLEQQVDDCDSDARVGTRTLAVRMGEYSARKILRGIFYPLNMISIVLLVAIVPLWLPMTLTGLVIGSAILALGFLGLRASSNNSPVSSERGEERFVKLARLLYNSREMPMGLAYLNAGFEVIIISTLGVYVVLKYFACIVLLLFYAGSLYYYSGLYWTYFVEFITLARNNLRVRSHTADK